VPLVLVSDRGRGRDPALAASLPMGRAIAFAGVAVPVSLIGHLAGGGSVPDEATLLLGIALAVIGHRTLLAARERSWPMLSLALGATQVALHALFTAGAPATPFSPAMPGMSMAGGGAERHGLASGLVMMLGHGLAAGLLGWFLRRGEQALWSAARRASSRTGAALRALLAVLALLLLLTPTSDEQGRHRPSAPVPWHSSRLRRYRATGGRYWRGPPSGRPSPA